MNKFVKSVPRHLFFEQRSAPLWTLITGIVFSLSLAIALYPRSGIVYALLVFFFMCIGVIVLFKRTQSPVSMDHKYLSVGRAKIERHWIAHIEVLDRAKFLDRIRSGASRTDFFALRTLDYGGVVIHISDESDPHKHWVVSLKDGNRLQEQWKRMSHV